MTNPNVILLYERYDHTGTLERTWLERTDVERTDVERTGGELTIHVGDASWPLPLRYVDAVFRRYGKPLDPDVPLSSERFALGNGRTLTRLRYLPRYDVIARDYLVLCSSGSEPLAELAPSIAAALVHLAQARGSAAGCAR